MKKPVRLSQVSSDGNSSEILSGYLSVEEASRIIGVSRRSVYGYIEAGRLPSTLIENLIMVRLKDARAFACPAPGRVRILVPSWHLPPKKNRLYLTTVTIRIRTGQDGLLENKLKEMHQANTYSFS